MRGWLALCLLAITLHAVIGQNYNYYNYENGGGEGNEGGQGGEHGSHRGDGMGGGRRGLKRAMIVKTIEELTAADVSAAGLTYPKTYDYVKAIMLDGHKVIRKTLKQKMETAKDGAATKALATLTGSCITDAATLRAFIESFKTEMKNVKDAHVQELVAYAQQKFGQTIEIPEKPERCNRGPPPAVKAKLEEAAAAIAAPGLCNAQAVHEWFKTTKETMQRTLMGQKRTLMEQIIAEILQEDGYIQGGKVCIPGDLATFMKENSHEMMRDVEEAVRETLREEHEGARTEDECEDDDDEEDDVDDDHRRLPFFRGGGRGRGGHQGGRSRGGRGRGRGRRPMPFRPHMESMESMDDDEEHEPPAEVIQALQAKIQELDSRDPNGCFADTAVAFKFFRDLKHYMKRLRMERKVMRIVDRFPEEDYIGKCVNKDYLKSLISHIIHKVHEGGQRRGPPRRGGRGGHRRGPPHHDGPPQFVKDAIKNFWDNYNSGDASCDGKMFQTADDLKNFIQDMANQIHTYIEANKPEARRQFGRFGGRGGRGRRPGRHGGRMFEEGDDVDVTVPLMGRPPNPRDMMRGVIKDAFAEQYGTQLEAGSVTINSADEFITNLQAISAKIQEQKPQRAGKRELVRQLLELMQ